MTAQISRSDPLLIERLGSWLGFSLLAKRLPASTLSPPYLYVSTFMAANVVFGTGYRYLQTGTIGFIENPFGLALPLGVAIATIGIMYMRAAQQTAEEQILTKATVQHGFAEYRSTFSLRTKLVVYGTVVAGYFAYEVFVIGIGTLLQTQGPVLAVFYNLLVLPLCYIAVGVEFVLVYSGVHFLLPRKLKHADLNLFFLDARNMGGFQPVGELFKKSYYVYTAGLLVYLAFFYGPVVMAGGPTGGAVQTGPVIAALFTALWLLGVGTLSYSMYQTHRIMVAEKNERLDEVEAKLREVVSDPYEDAEPEISDPEKLEAIQFQLNQIRNTSEYPTTFTMWTQIGVSVILPQALQLGLQYL
jgi:hypothetical protein